MVRPHYQMDYDPSVTISDWQMANKLGDAVRLGRWFVFLKADWLKRSGMDKVLATSGIAQVTPKPGILFRGKDEISLPGATIAPTPLPRPDLVSLTCDKALYRAKRDTIRLLIAAPQHPNKDLTLQLRLSGNPYAEYAVTLDENGLYLWSIQELPEGEYDVVAILAGEPDFTSASCHFEVAEYRLAPLNAELANQQINGETFRYTLSITSFGQPYSGSVEVELQERGQRVGKRETLRCNSEGQCRGVVKLTGAGPYTLNVFAGERTASVMLKGSEQERREALVISELGEIRTLSLLPQQQSNACRSMYISRGGSNTEPFLVQRVIGNEIEITSRVEAELLRVVVVNPAQSSSEERLYEQVPAEKSLHLPIPAPYGIVLLGAFIDGKAWEGWCTILCPTKLQLHCEAPKQAKPGTHIKVTLKVGNTDSSIPVQLIVKDQRVISPSDPEVELAARIKENLSAWSGRSATGGVERQLDQTGQPHIRYARPGQMRPMMQSLPTTSMLASDSAIRMPLTLTVQPGATPFPTAPMPVQAVQSPVAMEALNSIESAGASTSVVTSASTATMAKVRLQFPEVVYNRIVKVQGERSIEIKLGDGITRYSIEAFALSPETLDWQRFETFVDAVQPVYGELTVSPFVFPGDPVMGRLDVGAASGAAIVEVRHDGDMLPLFHADGSTITSGLPIPSGSVVRFSVRPGAITASVRDARKGGIDVSERYITEPGKLRHITRRLRLLTPGDEITLEELSALEIKPLPGLERPFQFFVEGASKYPFG